MKPTKILIHVEVHSLLDSGCGGTQLNTLLLLAADVKETLSFSNKQCSCLHSGSWQQHGAALGTAGWYWLVHLLADVILCHAFEPGVEPQVLLYTELIKENVVLRTHAQVLTDPIHFGADVVAVYGGRAGGGRKQACQDGPLMRTKTRMKTWFVGSATMSPSLEWLIKWLMCK